MKGLETAEWKTLSFTQLEVILEAGSEVLVIPRMSGDAVLPIEFVKTLDGVTFF